MTSTRAGTAISNASVGTDSFTGVSRCGSNGNDAINGHGNVFEG